MVSGFRIYLNDVSKLFPENMKVQTWKVQKTYLWPLIFGGQTSTTAGSLETATIFEGFKDSSLSPFLLFQLITSVRRRDAKSRAFSRPCFS